jgi:hypothetical protein
MFHSCDNNDTTISADAYRMSTHSMNHRASPNTGLLHRVTKKWLTRVLLLYT